MLEELIRVSRVLIRSENLAKRPPRGVDLSRKVSETAVRSVMGIAHVMARTKRVSSLLRHRPVSGVGGLESEEFSGEQRAWCLEKVRLRRIQSQDLCLGKFRF
jgi:hypothetical protein